MRRKHKANPLSADLELNTFAQHYAERMANEKFISHTTPEGLTFEKRMHSAGFSNGDFAENLGMGSTLQIALSGLENSGSHRRNLISRKWTGVGIGLARNTKGDVYVVQVFSKNIEE